MAKKNFIFVLSSILVVGVIGGQGLREKVPCIENGRFYRNPNRDVAYIWSTSECSKYYLCIDGEIFNFECSTGWLHYIFIYKKNLRAMDSYSFIYGLIHFQTSKKQFFSKYVSLKLLIFEEFISYC